MGRGAGVGQWSWYWTKPWRMERFSGHLFIRPSFHPSVCPSIHPPSGPYCQARAFGLTGLAFRLCWLGLRSGWLDLRFGWLGVRPCWLGLRPGWLGLRPCWIAWRGGGPTNRWTKEHLPILQDFIPYPGCCPKKNTVLWFILLVQPRKKTALENEPKIDFMHQIQQKVFSWS